MDVITLECVRCGMCQPKATIVDRDPLLHWCCDPLDQRILALLKAVDAKLEPTGSCFVCGVPVEIWSVFCARQSCLLLWALENNRSTFHVMPCAWTSQYVDPSHSCMVQQQQQVSKSIRRLIEGLVHGDDVLDAFLRSAHLDSLD